MKCTCPKCHKNIELDLPEVTEEGTSASCPECQGRFNVHRESFGARALRKTGEISCASCGDELGPQIHCTTCGAPFPDYVVAGLGHKRVRRAGTKLKLKSSPLQKPGRVMSQLPSLDMAMKQESPAAAKKQKGAGEGSSKTLKIAAGVIVLLALIAAGAGFYFKNETESRYLKNFALATYVIQVGNDRSRKICLRIANDWKAKIDAGQGFTPRPSADEEKELNTVKAKIDSIKSRLSAEPEKYKNCSETLAKIETPFNKMKALALSPGNSLPGFNDSVNRLDNEYKQGATQFKAAIPPEVMAELLASAQKYRGLRPLLK